MAASLQGCTCWRIVEVAFVLSLGLSYSTWFFKECVGNALDHSKFTPGNRMSIGTASLVDAFDLLALLIARTGDVRSFNALMERWERVFITNGTYLLMEKCLMLVYRNLVKKM